MSNFIKRKRLFLIICSMTIMVLMSGCGSKEAETSQGDAQSSSTGTTSEAAAPTENTKYKEEVVINTGAQVTTLDVQEVSNVAHNRVFKLTHDTLVDLDIDTGKIVPKLAKEWEWLSPTELQLKLRNDVFFHNGEELKASDVVFTFKRAENGKASTGRVSNFVDVVAVDDFTVKITLNKPFVDLLDNMTIPVYSILSEKALIDDPNMGYTVGTGVWKLNEFVSNDYVSFDRFDKYWGELTPTQKLKVKYVPESSVSVISLENGEADLCTDLTSSDAVFVEKNKDLSLVEIDGTTCQFFGFNASKAPWDNKLLRQAVAHAIVKEDIITATENGYGKLATTFWGNSQFGYYDGFGDYEYDLDEAKRLLAEAGYPNGLDLEITVPTGYRVTTAELLQAQLSQIGINVTINEVDSAALTSITNDGTHESFVYGLGFNTAGDDIRRAYSPKSTTNRSHYANDRVIELIDLAVAEFDTDKRLADYKEIQEIAHDEIPVIPLYYQTLFFGTNKNLGGVTWNSTSNTDFSGIYVIEK
ncbi:ABC transporter substrate-binding protein [Fusibacter ferrireducens]|uniref:ABC transporter substrate-binding protein n=1 Tax=Fusibacter ferrireducens TaxID=2785058 RepID=A0ABR9ZNT5_9FIRM|nr:ABC transporter substrate-binding protein [Fusibacter ferrireducens]MBF4692125.1 ABC transporter substrate-binding protein [Fusibacter ferrireducens]